MTEKSEAAAPSIIAHLKRSEDGKPYLQGARCGACGHTYVGTRETCAKCYARGQMQAVSLAEAGKLYAYAIVHTAFPVWKRRSSMSSSIWRTAPTSRAF